jgi:hypothetical protein
MQTFSKTSKNKEKILQSINNLSSSLNTAKHREVNKRVKLYEQVKMYLQPSSSIGQSRTSTVITSAAPLATISKSTNNCPAVEQLG